MTEAGTVWTEAEVRGAADALWAAERERKAIEPLTAARPMGHDVAYRVQMENARRREAAGERLVGFKVGLTSLEAQRQFGIDRPDVGHLFASMLVGEEVLIPAGELLQPRAEAEIGFLLGKELSGPGLTWIDAARAVEAVVATIEIVDSRIRDWRVKAADTIADNASSARFVVGSRLVPLSSIDLSEEGMALWKNGDVESSGSGAAVLGNPLEAVAIAANELASLGRRLRPGDLILSGAMSRMLAARPGDWFRAEFKSLGAVGVRFGKGEGQ